MYSKSVVILIILQFLLIIFLVFYQFEHFASSYFNQKAHLEKEEELVQPDKTDAVILFTKMKSGSTIVGSIFNKRKKVMYLYEPLYPFSETPCVFALEERLRVLYSVSSCHFEKVGPLYQLTRRPDTIAQ